MRTCHDVLVSRPRVGKYHPYPLIGDSRLSARVALGEYLAVIVHRDLPREKQQFLGVNPSDVGVHPHRPGHVWRIGGKPSLSHVDFPLKFEGRGMCPPLTMLLCDRRSPVLQLLRYAITFALSTIESALLIRSAIMPSISGVTTEVA